MPAPRTPRVKAAISGRDVHDPGRFKSRKEPQSTPIGAPPAWMSEEQTKTWREMVAAIPWLMESHRYLLEIAVTIRTRLAGGQDVGVQALNLLRQCLGQMGATPADASKVTVPDGNEEDPDDAFLNRLN